MKVLMINGSPHKDGTTFRALTEVAKTLNENGIETEIVTVGNQKVHGCMACGTCSKTGKCAFDDIVNELIDKLDNADGLIVGSPVYYAGANGTLVSILDRMFYGRKHFAYKPAASIAVARRAGTTATLDILNKYFLISKMPVVSSQYWNMVFGSNKTQAEEDKEGLQTMRTLGLNMAWLLKCIKAGKDSGVKTPDLEPAVRTNFVR
ncbi:MAG: flavodoxin family protein [Clostridia bacterium]|nr:flavodoxin family protein [Clostridia bacterium]